MGPLAPGFAVGISIEIMQSKPRRVILAVLTIVIGFPMALVAGILPHVFPLGPDSLPRGAQVSPGTRRMTSTPAVSCGTFSSSIRSK
jgi:hypothetical protein